jgi:hypothetical protein
VSVLVATSDGYHVFTSSGQHHTSLAGHSVDAFTPGVDGSWVAIVDGREVWRHAPDGTWVPLAESDVALQSVQLHRGRLFVGAYDATLFVLDDEALVEVPGFESMPGRGEWHAVGPPVNVRSMTSTSDDGALLANVHVGGIARSTDGGGTWAPTIAVDDDVHEVLAHPADPSLVVAAAAVGLCTSRDAGATWSVDTDGLPHTYARAVAFTDDAVLVSVSDGPFTERSAIYRRPLDGGRLSELGGGLPGEGLVGNVDTGCLATGRGQAALADGAGDVWWSATGVEAWSRLAGRVGEVRAVAIA